VKAGLRSLSPPNPGTYHAKSQRTKVILTVGENILVDDPAIIDMIVLAAWCFMVILDEKGYGIIKRTAV